jgi:hypothetical protein
MTWRYPGADLNRRYRLERAIRSVMAMPSRTNAPPTCTFPVTPCRPVRGHFALSAGYGYITWVSRRF